MQLYDYTILRQDGSIEEITGVKKKSFQTETNQKTGDVNVGLYKLLDCRTIEVIPLAYYEDHGWGECDVYGDEEARFSDENKTNPHMVVLFDSAGNPWDVVGDVIREKVHND